MKTLSNHIILYDRECPMCNLYTGAFVRRGLLDADGRACYQQYDAQACPNIDWQRAVNEIALIDKTSGQVTYGVDSLLKVCGNAWPSFGYVFNWHPFLRLAQACYAFVSYNRRVIIPVGTTKFRFQPSFKLKYRVYWLAFTWLITSAILNNYTKTLVGIFPVGTSWREFAVCGGQILFQGIIIRFFDKSKTWDYLGNMMTISLAGAILLFLFQSVTSGLQLHSLTYFVAFGLVVAAMVLEHLRRTKLLGIGLPMTFSWIFYRLLILLILL